MDISSYIYDHKYSTTYVCSLEWWTYEIVILLGGLLPNPEEETSVLSIWYVCFVRLSLNRVF